MEYNKIVENIIDSVRPLQGQGKQADYIPALANVNPDQMGFA